MYPWGRPDKLQCSWPQLTRDCSFQLHKGCKRTHPVQTTSLVGIGDSLLGQGLQFQMHNILRYIRNCMGWLLQWGKILHQLVDKRMQHMQYFQRFSGSQ